MKSAGKPHRSSRGKVISIAIIAIAVAVAIYVEHWISIHPSTDDATIDADVVHVAAAVGGRIIELPVAENAKVSKGDILFRIDPVPYRLAVEQAEADLEVAVGAPIGMPMPLAPMSPRPRMRPPVETQMKRTSRVGQLRSTSAMRLFISRVMYMPRPRR